MEPTRVLLADDHELVRAGIRALLRNIEGVEVVAEADDGREALRLIEACRPDVVLMDVAMKNLNGLEAASRVTMLSMYANEEYVLQALRAGAMGYLLKDAKTAELELAIQAVARGEMYLSPSVSKYVVADYLKRFGEEGGEPGSLDRLKPRQREVLQLIAEGQSLKEIAHALNLSVKTVETHRRNLMQQLDIHDVAGLVRYAIRTGLVAPES